MKVIYNNNIVSENDLQFKINHRGLLYGDGLFETIIYKNGVAQYLGRHISRLQNGMVALGMNGENIFEEEQVFNNIKKLINTNAIEFPVLRIKILVWRRSGGLYTPLDNHIDFVITCSEQIYDQPKEIAAAISKKVFLCPSLLSKYKTCNMLPYILAGIEKKQRNLPELVLLSNSGHIAECSSSNIFWIKGNDFFTPSLETGCIDGIMRAVIIDGLATKGKAVNEVKEKPEVLLKADAVFMSNVSGIRYLDKFEENIYRDTSAKTLLDGYIKNN